MWSFHISIQDREFGCFYINLSCIEGWDFVYSKDFSCEHIEIYVGDSDINFTAGLSSYSWKFPSEL